MSKFKLTIIALGITFLMLVSFVNSSDAIEIIELRPENNSYEAYDAGDGTCHRVYVETDIVFYHVNWYVDGKHSGWSDGSNVRDHTSFTLSNLTGSHNGTSYEIKAIVWSLDENGNAAFDTDSYTLTVYTFEIIELRSYNGSNIDYYYGVPFFTFYVRTNKPYGGLIWSVDGGAKNAILGDGNKKDHYFSFSNFSGSLKGNTYKIEVSAYGLDPNGHLVVPTDNMDTATYEFTLYEPIIETQTSREKSGLSKGDPHVSGYVKLWRQYFDGSVISINCSAYAHNSSKNTDSVEAYGVFRHTILNKPFDERETFMPALEFSPGESYGPYVSGSLSFPCTYIGKKDEWVSDAYIRLKIVGELPDDYYLGNVITFTDEDNLTD